MRQIVANIKNNKLQWLIGSIVCLPFLLLVCLVAHYAVNVPFWDQWELVPLLEKMHNGTLGFADFFAQHNEHRLFFPRIAMIVLAWATHWNTHYELVFSLAVAATSFVFLYLIIMRTFKNKWLAAGAAIATSLVFFSPMAWENWLWGWQIQWYLNIAGLIIAVWALTTWRYKSDLVRVLVAAAAAVVATYSLASGLFVWFVCLPIFIFNPAVRKWWKLWITLAVISIGVHYIGYVDPSYHPSKGIFLHQPLDYIHYVLVYIARPIVVDFLLSVNVAVLYMVSIFASLIYVWRYKRQQLTSSLLPWLCLGLYACFAAASTGVSRLGFGVEQAYASRYTTLSIFLLIACLVTLFKIIELTLERGIPKKAGTAARYVIVIILTLLLQAILLNYPKSVVQMKQKSEYLQTVSFCAHTAESSQDECLVKLYPNKDVAWERLEYLRSVHWGNQ